MAFMNEAQLRAQITGLNTKLLRQQIAVSKTESEIAHWDDQLALLKKEDPAKK